MPLILPKPKTLSKLLWILFDLSKATIRNFSHNVVQIRALLPFHHFRQLYTLFYMREHHCLFVYHKCCPKFRHACQHKLFTSTLIEVCLFVLRASIHSLTDAFSLSLSHVLFQKHRIPTALETYVLVLFKSFNFMVHGIV